MEKKYWIRINKESKGPYSIEELRDKNIQPKDYIWAQGFENWMKLEEVEDFRKIINHQQLQKSKSTALPIIIIVIFIIGFLSLYFIGKQLQNKDNNLGNLEIATETGHSEIDKNKSQESGSVHIPIKNQSLIAELDKKYDLVIPFTEGLAVVIINGKVGYVDEMGKEVIPPKYDWGSPFSEGLAAVQKDGKYGYIDKSGKIVIPFSNYSRARIFSDGLAAVEVDYKKWGFINKEGKLVIPAIYEDVRDFKHGFAGVGINIKLPGIVGDYGFINKNGQDIVPLIYKSIGKDFNNDNGILIAELVDKQGKKVWVGDDGKPAMWED